MTHIPRDLQTTAATLVPLEGDFSPILHLTGATSSGVNMANLSDDCVRRLMADAILDEPGGDAKLAAAYLMGTVSWSICEPLAGLALRGLWLAAARSKAVSLIQRFVHWEQDGEKGVSLAFDVHIDPDQAAFVDMPALPGFATTLEQIHTSLVDRLYAISGLSRAALWRLVADSLAAAFLEHGRAIGQTDLAMSHARNIIRDKSSKLFNKQTDFAWIDLPEAPETGDWMRVRGGCCRYYTAPREDADYCTTCVLRSDESRRERYRNYLRRTRTEG
ncbi:MAG: (2Fe-2S)-binding protein [Pseudomonadota bacterium]